MHSLDVTVSVFLLTCLFMQYLWDVIARMMTNMYHVKVLTYNYSVILISANHFGGKNIISFLEVHFIVFLAFPSKNLLTQAYHLSVIYLP